LRIESQIGKQARNSCIREIIRGWLVKYVPSSPVDQRQVGYITVHPQIAAVGHAVGGSRIITHQSGSVHVAVISPNIR